MVFIKFVHIGFGRADIFAAVKCRAVNDSHTVLSDRDDFDPDINYITATIGESRLRITKLLVPA